MVGSRGQVEDHNPSRNQEAEARSLGRSLVRLRVFLGTHEDHRDLEIEAGREIGSEVRGSQIAAVEDMEAVGHGIDFDLEVVAEAAVGSEGLDVQTA